MDNKGKKKGSALAITLPLAALALLFINGRGIGLGGKLGLQPAAQQSAQVQQSEQPQAEPQPTEAPAAPVEDANSIVVHEGVITYMGADVSAEELRAALLEHYESGDVTVADEQAIKGVYDAVVGLLDELAIPYKIA